MRRLEIAMELLHVGGIRGSPTVDGLVWIADDRDVVVLHRQLLYDGHLDGVRVLILSCGGREMGGGG